MVPLRFFVEALLRQDGHICAVAELRLMHVKRYF